MEWAAEFYKKQFLLTKRNLGEISKSTYLQEVSRIQEQIGKPFFKLLELGAGNGQLANALANKNYEDDKSTQSLKCYSISRIYELCQSANLDIVGYFPNDAMDFETWSYYETASLDYCISYRIKVKKK